MPCDRELDEMSRLRALAKLSDQCISVFEVDLRTGLYTIVKHPGTTSVMDREDRRWDLALGRDFAAECLGDTQEVIRKVGSVEFLRQELQGVKYREYIYAHREKVDDHVQRRCEVLATERDERGVAVRALVDFIAVDDAAAEQREKAEYLSVVTRALFGYNLMVNLETLRYKVILGTGTDSVSDVFNRTDDYRAAFDFKIGFVAPKDRGRLIDLLSPEALKRYAEQGVRGAVGGTVIYEEIVDGASLWHETNVFIGITAAGEPVANILGRNVTERVRERQEEHRRLEQALAEVRDAHARGELIVDALHSAMMRIMLGADDRIVGWEFSRDIGRVVRNPKAARIREWDDLVHPDDREAARSAFFATLKDHTGKTPYDATFRMLDENGRYNWFRSVGNVFRREDGTGEFYGIHIDVTERIEQQQKLEQEAAQAKIDAAEETSRAKTMFLANMSHDIRTPMNAIIGFTDIARKHVNDPKKVHEYLDKVQAAGSNLLEIINDILDMSKIDSQKVEVTEYPAWISRMPRYFHTILSAKMAEHRHEFVCERGECRDETVWIDKPHLNRIVVNLLTNALKYTPDGGRILFRVEQLPDRGADHARFRIVVEDNGIGMSEEFQRHLFERFSRERNSTASGIQGTGIGMAIVKSLTEAMGGTIEVESKEGVGTKFTLEFDFRRRRPGEGEIEEEGQRSEVKGQTAEEENLNHHCRTSDLQPPPSRPAKRILLVEDNEINREIALEILRNAGYEADVAVNGREAVEKVVGVKSWSGRADEKFHSPTPAQNSNYDLILMDIMMPVMNGLEAAKAIRAAGSAVPIVALSANAFTEDREASLAAGMNDHLSKPIKVRDLMECLAKFGKKPGETG